jgi:hypothetical protein
VRQIGGGAGDALPDLRAAHPVAVGARSGEAHRRAAPSIDFGEVMIGAEATRPFSIANTSRKSVTGASVTNWSYDASSNRIVFPKDAVPPPGSHVSAQYAAGCN